MAIRLETSKRQGIANHQDTEISAYCRNWARDLPKAHPKAIQRTPLSPTYNCHGLTFANRRTRIENTAEIHKIVDDDQYHEVPLPNVLPGDVAIYYAEDGDANHSGLVVDVPDTLGPIICSKWGAAGEYVHALRDCPKMYGPVIKFYRCRL